MIKRFEEFIKEGFMTRSLNRNKSGEERLENKLAIKDVCKFISEIISEHCKIPYSDSICTCDGNTLKAIGGETYQLHFKFKKWDFTYTISAPEDTTSIPESLIAVSTSISVGLQFHREITPAVKKILEHVSDELKTILKDKYLKND